MSSSLWGKNQIAFFPGGVVSEQHGTSMAHGIVNYSTNPSSVYVFGYPEQEQSLTMIVGQSGVTEDSSVFDNASGKLLGKVKDFIDKKAKESLVLEAIQNKVAHLMGFSFNQEAINSLIDNAWRDKQNGISAPRAYPDIKLYSESKDFVLSGGIERQLSYLIAHGFSPECIYDQAAIRNYTQEK